MHRLLTLGAIDLRGDDGHVVTSVLSQPKRLALLTYLALREPTGFHQRNALLPMFWPESDEAHARNALRNALHFLRAELGAEVVASRGNDEVGVNPDALWCDALAFTKAIKQGRFGEALQYWRGPLLDGFLPTDLPDYTEWLDNRRRAFDWLAADAARGLAERATASGNSVNALAATKRWVEIAPHDEAAIRALVTHLDAAGQRGDAREALERWTARFEREIGAPLAAETTALSARLRRVPARVEEPKQQKQRAIAVSEPVAVEGVELATMPTLARRGRRWPVIAAGVLVALLAIAAAAAVRAGGDRGQPIESGGTAVAVLPFSYAGSPQYDYLREAMVDLVSTRIDAASALRTVDSRSVLSRAERTVARQQAIDPTHGRSIAGEFGAAYFVLGSVIEVQRKLHLSAALYSRASGSGDRPLARLSLSGDVNDVFALADSVTESLLHALASARRVEAAAAGGEAGAGTKSVDALREFTDGEIAFNQARYNDAATAYGRATAIDPHFARAWFRLSIADSWAGGGAPLKAPLANAQRDSARLSADDRLLLHAWTEHIFGRPRSADSLYSLYVAAHPDNAEALFQLAEVRFHWGSAFGTPAADAAEMFRRALALLPDHAASIVHLVRLSGRNGDSSAVAGLTAKLLALGPSEVERLEAQIVLAFNAHQPDTAHVSSLLRDASPAALNTLRASVTSFAASVPRPEALAPLAARLAIGAADQSLMGHYAYSGVLEASAGRFRDGALATRRLGPALAIRAAELRALYAALPFTSATTREATLLRDTVRLLPGVVHPARQPEPPNFGAQFEPRQLLLDGLLSLRVGDTATVQRIILLLEDPRETRVGEDRVAAFRRDYAALLRARLLLARGDARGAVEALGAPHTEPTLTYPALVSYGHALERFSRAEALHLAGRDDEALRWFDGFPDNSGYDIEFVAPAQLAAARIDAQHGRVEAARQRYQRVIMLWAHADAELQPIVAKARGELARLSKVSS